MAQQRAAKGRGLFYTRDSDARHEMTPAKYVEWAIGEADRLGVSFSGTPSDIERMMREDVFNEGDLFFDFGAQGHLFSRKALEALMTEAENDRSVSHIFIPRRDRLARPNDPIDGVQLENNIRRAGVCVVYRDRIAPPIARGARQEIGDLITSIVDFEKSGEERRQLAGKILPANINVASQGYSTGGRAPYGFRRWLVKEDGSKVRQLEDGEHVRQKGYHVAFFPHTPEIAVVQRILEMLKTMPASQVAKVLTNEGVPSPDAGRHRNDNGFRHKVSGKWHGTTISNIARNTLLEAKTTYGRRSMGDQLRYSADGPRELEDTDFRADGKPKVVTNPQEVRTHGEAKFAAVVDVHEHEELIRKLDKRATSQKGIPRSKDPSKNPLGGRIFDLNCSWPMYRNPYKDTFRYKCGLYEQSHGQQCAHNTVPGPEAARYVLTCTQQKLLNPHRWMRLQNRIREIAADSTHDRVCDRELDAKRAELTELQEQRETAERNLALAKSEPQFDVISRVYEELRQREATCVAQLGQLQSQAGITGNIEGEIEVALLAARRMSNLAAEGMDDLGVARKLIELINARIFVRFQTVQEGKRTLNKIAGGVVTWGDTPPPIKLYDGRTARQNVKNPAKKLSAGLCSPSDPNPTTPVTSSEEGGSLGNRSRGERI